MSSSCACTQKHATPAPKPWHDLSYLHRAAPDAHDEDRSRRSPLEKPPTRPPPEWCPRLNRAGQTSARTLGAYQAECNRDEYDEDTAQCRCCHTCCVALRSTCGDPQAPLGLAHTCPLRLSRPRGYLQRLCTACALHDPFFWGGSPVQHEGQTHAHHDPPKKQHTRGGNHKTRTEQAKRLRNVQRARAYTHD